MAAIAPKTMDGPTHFDHEQNGGVTPSNGQYVTFMCSGRAYGIDIMRVREIRSWSPTTELPEQPTGSCGVLDIRGEVVQVFDLNLVLTGESAQITDGHVVLVVTMEDRTMGILVDAVSDIIEITEKEMRAPPPTKSGKPGMVSGVAKREDTIIAIFDLPALLSSVHL